MTIETTAGVPGDPVAAVTHRDPYPFYAGLVRERPIYRDEALRLWVFSSAESVAAVLNNAACRVRPPGEPVPSPLVGSPVGEVFRGFARMNDGRHHRAMKLAVTASLESVAPDAIATAARHRARILLGMAGGSTGEVLDAVAFRLPVEVVASLLGVRDDLLAGTAALAGTLVGSIASGADAAECARGGRTADALAALVRTLLAEGNPILTRLARAAVDAGCGEEAVIANAIGLLFQAHDATAGLIGNGLVALASQRDARRHLAADPRLFTEFVREVARHDPPVQNTRRFVAEPTEVAGTALAPGDAILVVLAAANRDPALNPEPHRFELSRNRRRSFTFGAGPHVCPGESLATIIAAAALELLNEEITALAPLVARRTYRPSVNARLPRFGG
jgi:cytochrome P450